MASADDQYMAKMAFVRISRTWPQTPRQNVVIQQLGNRSYLGVNLGRDIEIVKFDVPAELRALSGPLAEFEPYKRASTVRTNRYGYSYTRVTAQPRWQINRKYRLICCIDLRDDVNDLIAQSPPQASAQKCIDDHVRTAQHLAQIMTNLDPGVAHGIKGGSGIASDVVNVTHDKYAGFQTRLDHQASDHKTVTAIVTGAAYQYSTLTIGPAR